MLLISFHLSTCPCPPAVNSTVFVYSSLCAHGLVPSPSIHPAQWLVSLSKQIGVCFWEGRDHRRLRIHPIIIVVIGSLTPSPIGHSFFFITETVYYWLAHTYSSSPTCVPSVPKIPFSCPYDITRRICLALPMSPADPILVWRITRWGGLSGDQPTHKSSLPPLTERVHMCMEVMGWWVRGRRVRMQVSCPCQSLVFAYRGGVFFSRSPCPMTSTFPPMSGPQTAALLCLL